MSRLKKFASFMYVIAIYKAKSGAEGVLSTAFIKDVGSCMNRGHHCRQVRASVRSSAGAEKDGEGMALKI